MTRDEITLAALATAGTDWWTPVQVQKLFFLLDDRAGQLLSGPHFNFVPYDYGPFDADVYRAIETQEQQGLAEIDRPAFGMKRYRLSEHGAARGRQLLEQMEPAAQRFVRDLSQWLRGLSFAQLVSAVYAAYPGMRANSVFRE